MLAKGRDNQEMFYITIVILEDLKRTCKNIN